jgi:tetratricopeptide (TPR) repeat protein
MTVSKALSLCAVSFVLFMLLGCAGTQSGLGRSKVSPGVSPEIAAQADEIAKYLFVPRAKEKEAQTLSAQGLRHYAVTDSLWKLLDESRKKNAPRVKPAADSVNGSQVNLAANNPADPKTQASSSSAGIDIVESRTTIQAKYNLLEARKKLENALARDPYKPVTKHYLALTYKLFAEKFPGVVTLERAADQWRELAKLEPGEYLHYYNLGAVHYTLQQWREALSNFQRAEQTLADYAEVSNERLANPSLAREAATDSTRWFDAAYLQAQALIRLVIAKQQKGRTPEADSVLRHLQRAQRLTAEAQWLALIEGDIKWVQWDSLNLWGSAQRDTASLRASRGQFEAAAQIYEDLPRDILQTKRAKDDVRWEYATIVYAKLRRRALAIDRLAEVIQSVAQDSSGAPRDTTYNRMFENFGAMCYYLGQDTMKVDRKVAFQYFERAAAVKWKERGRCYLFMADLTKTNPEFSLRHAESALALSDNFTTEEMKSLYRLLIEGYRRKNQMDKARLYMDKFREL